MSFIAFEGVDGSGKSTLIQQLMAYLQSQKVDAIVTREPGGTSLGDDIRKLLLRTDGEAPTPRAELLLYQAGRAQHVDKLIRPALQKNQWVLCDRYYASTVAFQVGGRKLDRAPIDWLNDFAIDGCKPDLWVLLDLPVEQSLSRLQMRSDSGGGEKDRFELEQVSFHQRVRDRYLKLAREENNWLILDANESKQQLFESLLKELRGRQWLA